MTKNEARFFFEQKRTEISPKQLREASEDICHLLFSNFNFLGKKVSLFLPIERKKEINTYLILDKAIAFGATVCVPKANFSTHKLKHYRYDGPEQLELSEYQIPEPKKGKVIPASKIDVVIVPLLAYDRKGYRVGYGKGFYDRFLSQCSKKCIFIGLSLYEPMEKIEDVEKTDIPLDYCITPHKKWLF